MRPGAAVAPSLGSRVAGAPKATPAFTYVVNSTADGGDAANDGVCQTATVGQCTLRAALQEANRRTGSVLIAFNVPGTGVQTIAPATALPQLNNTSGITIDGFTQPGSAPNTDPIADNAVYGIELLNANEQLRAADEGKLVLVDETAGKEVALPLSLD